MALRITVCWFVVALLCVSCRVVQKEQNDDVITGFETYYNLGEQAEETGNYELAVSYFGEAIKYSDRNNIAKTAIAYNYLGQIALQQGKYNEAMEYFHKALNNRIALKDAEGQASSYRNIGAAYQMSGYFEQAQKQYEKSRELYEQLNNEKGIAECLINLGELWIEQNKPQQALEYFLESKSIFSNAGSSAQLWKVYYNIGYSYYLMNGIEQAREYYSMMLEQSHLLSSHSSLSETYRLMAHFFDDIEQRDSAIYYYSKAIEIAHLNGVYEVLYNALEERSRLYAIDNRYRDAYHDLMAYGYAYDAVHNSEMVKAFTQKSMQYEFDMQQREQLYRNRIQRIVIVWLSVAAFLVCVVGMVSYRGFVQKKRANALLEEQNDMLEHQKAEIAEKNEAITDSIRYASLIQKATLPAKEYSDKLLPEHFIYYKPRDIVSGDFYWLNHTDDEHIIIAAADCTGHGVPGAILSMLGISTLSKIVGKMKMPKPDLILNELRDEIIRLLNPIGSADTRQDGMDMALVVINTKIREIEYAGAYNPLFLIRHGQLIEKKANRMPVGLHVSNNETFAAERFSYKSNDVIYMFSDGYPDQFGGKKGGKFKTKNFKNLLLEISHYSMEEQARMLDNIHLEWRGTQPQIDDILVMGIKLP